MIDDWLLKVLVGGLAILALLVLVYWIGLVIQVLVSGGVRPLLEDRLDEPSELLVWVVRIFVYIPLALILGAFAAILGEAIL